MTPPPPPHSPYTNRTVQYTAPEVLLMQAGNQEGSSGVSSATVTGNPAWDVWSLGMVLAEILLGCTFFSG